jgi:hypothetical protein
MSVGDGGDMREGSGVSAGRDVDVTREEVSVWVGKMIRVEAVGWLDEGLPEQPTPMKMVRRRKKIE